MSGPGACCVHASLVALAGRGVLIRGPSGAGKSDLALRLVNEGFALVADDHVELRPVDGRLHGRAPRPLAGLIEVRGLGLFRLPHLHGADVALIADLLAPGAVAERLPAPRAEEICGVALPVVALAGFHASAPAALRLALSAPSHAGAMGDAP